MASTSTLPSSKAAHGPTPPSADEQELARLARALAHPARVRIVRFLAARETCIGGDIVDELGLAQSTVSEHLRILKSAGLIQGQIERPRVCYCVNPDALQRLRTLIDDL
jgi:ArsR family transcriptional regulator, arsenate/arsenite/antimonite-responsive transcriptional repressor